MDTRKDTCCVTGSRPQKLPFGFDEAHPDCAALKKRLREELEKSIKSGYAHFLSGCALGVDQWALELLLDLKKCYPHIKIEAVIPCENQDLKWNLAKKERYRSLLVRCDIKTMLQSAYSPDCMRKRNQYMVDRSALVIAVWNMQSGGTKQTVAYAKKSGKAVVLIPAGAMA
ncbi:MAG: DUF1273 domain-containing protein [Oscillospiraceae bacterium]|nr:DUF1273 domain-containing protein [Oscillospiraceae bacterium]